MAFRFRCSACHDLISAAETMVGVRIHCAACGTELEVPSPPPPSRPAKPTAGKAVVRGPLASEPASTELAGPESVEPNAEALADEAPLNLHARKKPPQDDMDMTPMVDVTFLLLIFFMITAAFALQKSLPVPTPQEAKQTAAPKTLADFEDDPQWVVVKIDSTSTFHVISGDLDKETPSRHELLVQLRQARQRSATRMLVVAHGDARHEQVVIAMDSGTAVGLEEVKLISVEEDL